MNVLTRIPSRRGVSEKPRTRLLLTLHVSQRLYEALVEFCSEFPALAQTLENAADSPWAGSEGRDRVVLVMEAEELKRFSDTFRLVPPAGRMFGSMSEVQLRKHWEYAVAHAD